MPFYTTWVSDVVHLSINLVTTWHWHFPSGQPTRLGIWMVWLVGHVPYEACENVPLVLLCFWLRPTSLSVCQAPHRCFGLLVLLMADIQYIQPTGMSDQRPPSSPSPHTLWTKQQEVMLRHHWYKGLSISSRWFHYEARTFLDQSLAGK